jgi:phosphoserine aminotransferase
MTDVYNFSPGPAALPRSVLEKVQAELLNWHNLGVSVMEVSHRSPYFLEIVEHSTALLRELLAIPDHYQILFLQGGAQLQFAGVPLNLLDGAASADYIRTGRWSDLAYQEAKKYADISLACDAELNGYTTIPDAASWQLSKDAAYCYYCDNETVHGLEFTTVPDVAVPLVADMSSNLFSRAIDIERFGVIIACAQKNFGPAGVTVVIVRDDLLQRDAHPMTPLVMNYRENVARQSMINTPATFPWYVATEVFEWVKKEGGVNEMDRRARVRSALLYNLIDESRFYDCPIDPNYRSRMNVVFDLPTAALTQQFIQEAEQQGLLFLKGHKARGGIRASLYNAMPMAGVKKLATFMQQFEKLNV